MRLLIKPLDIIIILLVAGLTFFAVYFVYMKPQGRSQFLIRGQGGEWTFPVGAEETIVVNGPLGNTIVRLNGQRAWVESSPCDNQNCVASGFLSRQGQWSACLPNNVLVIISGTEDNDVDEIAW